MNTRKNRVQNLYNVQLIETGSLYLLPSSDILEMLHNAVHYYSGIFYCARNRNNRSDVKLSVESLFKCVIRTHALCMFRLKWYFVLECVRIALSLFHTWSLLQNIVVRTRLPARSISYFGVPSYFSRLHTHTHTAQRITDWLILNFDNAVQSFQPDMQQKFQIIFRLPWLF